MFSNVHKVQGLTAFDSVYRGICVFLYFQIKIYRNEPELKVRCSEVSLVIFKQKNYLRHWGKIYLDISLSSIYLFYKNSWKLVKIFKTGIYSNCPICSCNIQDIVFWLVKALICVYIHYFHIYGHHNYYLVK